MPDIFISYSQNDKDFVSELTRNISKKTSLTYWIDNQNIHIGESLNKKITKGIEACKYFFIIISESSINSKWVSKELELALKRHKSKRRRPNIIPIFIDEIAPDLHNKLVESINDFLGIDYSSFENFDLFLENLLSKITTNDKRLAWIKKRLFLFLGVPIIISAIAAIYFYLIPTNVTYKGQLKLDIPNISYDINIKPLDDRVKVLNDVDSEGNFSLIVKKKQLENIELRILVESKKYYYSDTFRISLDNRSDLLSLEILSRRSETPKFKFKNNMESFINCKKLKISGEQAIFGNRTNRIFYYDYSDFLYSDDIGNSGELLLSMFNPENQEEVEENMVINHPVTSFDDRHLAFGVTWTKQIDGNSERVTKLGMWDMVLDRGWQFPEVDGYDYQAHNSILSKSCANTKNHIIIPAAGTEDFSSIRHMNTILDMDNQEIVAYTPNDGNSAITTYSWSPNDEKICISGGGGGWSWVTIFDSVLTNRYFQEFELGNSVQFIKNNEIIMMTGGLSAANYIALYSADSSLTKKKVITNSNGYKPYSLSSMGNYIAIIDENEDEDFIQIQIHEIESGDFCKALVIPKEIKIPDWTETMISWNKDETMLLVSVDNSIYLLINPFIDNKSLLEFL